MKNVAILGVSALALALGGCTFFHGHGKNASANSQHSMNPPAAAAGTSSGSSQQSAAGASGMSASQRKASAMTGAETSAASPADIKKAQQALQSQGMYQGKIDGVLGPQTKQALKDFQGKNGLQQTGSLDQRTLAALNGAAPSTGSSTPPAASSSEDSGSNK